MTPNVFITPLVSAFVGWGTNTIAVMMLFRPYKPINILGYQLQGLIPKRQKELATKVAKTIEAHLISHQDILEVIDNDENKKELLLIIEKQIDGFIDREFGSHPLFGGFVKGDFAAGIRKKFKDQLELALPAILTEMTNKIETHVSFQAIIEKKIIEFDCMKIERLILDVSKRELRAIEYLGGVLGFIIGVIQIIMTGDIFR